MLVKKLAGAFNLVAGFWLIGISLGTCVSASMPVCPAPSFIPVIIIGLVLMADSIPCFFERWIGFPVGIFLALTAIVLIFSQSWGTSIEIRVITFALPAVAIALNAKAALSKRPKLSEENHPLNFLRTDGCGDGKDPNHCRRNALLTALLVNS